MKSKGLQQSVGAHAYNQAMSDSIQIEAAEPLEVFDQWLQLAAQSEPNDPNAAALATATSSGLPTVRMVLVKPIGSQRFCFFTNVESKKGVQLLENPRVALCFHWKTLRRQVRVEGTVSELDTRDVDIYFHSRPRTSQIGACVSQQSRVLGSREELEERVERFGRDNPGEIPRPAYWRGFQLHPQTIEFWVDGANRLHDRFEFTKFEDGWRKARLFP